MTANRALVAAALAALLVLPPTGCRGTAVPAAPPAYASLTADPADPQADVDGALDAIERELAGDAREEG